MHLRVCLIFGPAAPMAPATNLTFLYKLSYALYSVLDFCSILKGGRGVRKSLNRTEPAELCQAEPTLRRWLIDIDYIISYYSIHFMLFYKMNYQSLPKITPTKKLVLGKLKPLNIEILRNSYSLLMLKSSKSISFKKG